MDSFQKIADKAHELFIMYGIRSISMDDIARSLGISKKTIYNFFDSKDALVTAIIEKEISDNVGKFESLRTKQSNAILKLFFMLLYAKQFYRRLHPSILHDLEHDHSDAFKKIDDHKHCFLTNVIKNNLNYGIESAIYQNNLNVDLITQVLLENLTLILNRTQPHINEYPEEVIGYLISGLLTPKGMALIDKYQFQNSEILLSQEFGLQPFRDH